LLIAALHKSRWQVELFNWIKQQLRIYVLIAIVKKELYLSASFYTLPQILSVSVFEKTQISCASQSQTNTAFSSPIDNQLIAFDF